VQDFPSVLIGFGSTERRRRKAKKKQRARDRKRSLHPEITRQKTSKSEKWTRFVGLYRCPLQAEYRSRTDVQHGPMLRDFQWRPKNEEMLLKPFLKRSGVCWVCRLSSPGAAPPSFYPAGVLGPSRLLSLSRAGRCRTLPQTINRGRGEERGEMRERETEREREPKERELVCTTSGCDVVLG